jgi:Cu-processing system permease protein
MAHFTNLLYVAWKWTLRDRVFHALIGVSLLLFLLVPSFSLFSMRQAQELSITLSLSAISLVLLFLATLLGASSIWRDVERRYINSVLGLPISRASFVLGKFSGIVCLLVLCALVLGVVSMFVIAVTSVQYPSPLPIRWQNVIAAIASDTCKYILLAACATLFSALSTSFFLPFFGTISVYLAGSASQDVYEYITGDYAKSISPLFKGMVRIVYYILPNFAAFNFKVQAIYGLPLSLAGLMYTGLYCLIYVTILLFLSVWIFSRRELP